MLPANSLMPCSFRYSDICTARNVKSVKVCWTWQHSLFHHKGFCTCCKALFQPQFISAVRLLLFGIFRNDTCNVIALPISFTLKTPKLPNDWTVLEYNFYSNRGSCAANCMKLVQSEKLLPQEKLTFWFMTLNFMNPVVLTVLKTWEH